MDSEIYHLTLTQCRYTPIKYRQILFLACLRTQYRNHETNESPFRLSAVELEQIELIPNLKRLSYSRLIWGLENAGALKRVSTEQPRRCGRFSANWFMFPDFTQLELTEMVASPHYIEWNTVRSISNIIH